jgi:hypothetical protein
MYTGDCLGGLVGQGEERILRKKKDRSMLYIYTYENSIMKPTKHCLKEVEEEKWEYNEGSELVQHCTIYRITTVKSPC